MLLVDGPPPGEEIVVSLAEDELLAGQLAYYRACAAQYDRPYAEVAYMRHLPALVEELPVAGDVLELACGTGQWTARLSARARTVTAVDASAEVLAIARTRAPEATFVQADVFTWEPPDRYDTVFFAFWLSHVPPPRLPAFWTRVAGLLRPGGRAIFVDDGPGVAAYEEGVADGPVPTVERRLDDGSRHRVVKVFHDPRTLAADLRKLGWTAHVRSEGLNYIGVAERDERG